MNVWGVAYLMTTMHWGDSRYIDAPFGRAESFIVRGACAGSLACTHTHTHAQINQTHLKVFVCLWKQPTVIWMRHAALCRVYARRYRPYKMFAVHSLVTCSPAGPRSNVRLRWEPLPRRSFQPTIKFQGTGWERQHGAGRTRCWLGHSRLQRWHSGCSVIGELL